MPQLLQRTINSLTRLGPRRSMETLLSMIEDAVFDLRLGTDMTGRVLQAELTVINPEHQAQAKPYFLTRARALRRAFAQSGAPLDRGFLDIGCGKGKAIITAALFGFKRVRGIEFAPELVSVAKQNLDKARRLLPPGTELTVVCADATAYDYGPDDCVFFLYNPFGGDVMREFAQQLARSLRQHPRKLWVIYTDPAYLAELMRELPLQEQPRLTYGGYEIAFLTHTPVLQ